MRVCFIEDTPLRGGTQIWVVEATQNFLNSGHKVNIIAPKDSYVAVSCAELGASVYTYDWKEISSNQDKYVDVWTKALRSSDVSICTVHPPRNNFHCSIFAAKCIKLGNLDTIHIPKTGSIVPWYKSEYYVPDSSINHSVISITEYTRDYLINEYNIPSETVSLVYQGTEVDRFSSTDKTKSEAKKRYPTPDGAYPILGSIGSFEDRKGQIILIQAMKKLIDSGRMPNVHALLVGEGPDEEMLKAVVKVYGIENHVTFYSFTDEPTFLYDSIDILTLPSLYKEGLPNVILEAMSMGVPVVASRMTGVPEVVIPGETGFMTDIGNVEQFADAIENLSTDKQLMVQMGKNSRALMKNKFDKKNQFSAFIQYFESIT